MTMMAPIALLAFAGLQLSAVAAVKSAPRAADLLYAFTDGTFIENVAVRPSGSLLLTTLSHPWVYTFDPTSASPKPHVFARFDSPTVNCTVGITEFEPDVYAVVGAVCNMAAFSVTKVSVWTVDARTARVRHVADLPDVGTGNDVAPLPGRPGSVLVSDSMHGAVWRVDTRSGAVKRVIHDEALAPDPAGIVPLGINGLRVVDREVIFVNSAKGFVGRVPIHADGVQAGPVEVLFRPSGISGMDDFDVDMLTGRIYIANHPAFIEELTLNGKFVSETPGFNTTVGPAAGPTSCVLGRGRQYRKVLYVVGGDGGIFSLHL